MTASSIKARPTVYAGVQMRSRLEADYAQLLDTKGIDWQYEPACYAGPAGQWLPDFSLTEDGRLHLVEVKPVAFLDEGFDDRDPVRRVDELLTRMEAAWLSEPAAFLYIDFCQFGVGSNHRLMAHGAARSWVLDSAGVPGYYLWPGMGQLQATHAARTPSAGRITARMTAGGLQIAPEAHSRTA